eukprot:6191095-Pleurochrysis_carterae.AAC.1
MASTTHLCSCSQQSCVRAETKEMDSGSLQSLPSLVPSHNTSTGNFEHMRPFPLKYVNAPVDATECKPTANEFCKRSQVAVALASLDLADGVGQESSSYAHPAQPPREGETRGRRWLNVLS